MLCFTGRNRSVTGLLECIELFLLLFTTVGVTCQKECAFLGTNKLSGVVCSHDRRILDVSSDFDDESPSYEPAGRCNAKTGRCDCVEGYTRGRACELLTVAGSNRSDPILVNEWRYLAKTCWGPYVMGMIHLTIEYQDPECFSLRKCNEAGASNADPDLEGVDYSRRPLPEILFYSSYNDDFARFIGKSESGLNHTVCKEDTAIFRDKLVCREENRTSARCTMRKSYKVLNRENGSPLIYIAVGGCGVHGVVTWSIRTQLSQESINEEKEAAQSDIRETPFVHGVCGARGVALEYRCLASAGGSCQVQEPSIIRAQSTGIPRGISRKLIAILAVVFCFVLLCGLTIIKLVQMHKPLPASFDAVALLNIYT